MLKHSSFFTVSATYISQVWSQRGSDAVLYTNILDTVSVDSHVHCNRMCLHLSGCFGFDYSESDGECILHDGAAMTITTPQQLNRGEERWQNFGELSRDRRPPISLLVFLI